MLRNFVGISKKVVSNQFSSKKKQFKFLSTPIKLSIDESKLPAPTVLGKGTIECLERVSLVGFENEEAVKIVEEAIRFADQIFLVDTTDIKPLVTVLENESLHLREDVIRNDVTRNELLSHSAKSIENYYVVSELKTKDSKEALPEKEKICQN